MTLILDQKSGARERILAFGGAGSGKTHDWLSIANRYAVAAREGRPLGRFYVIDSDFTVERSMEAYPGVEEVVEFRTTPEWGDYTEAIDLFTKKVTRFDWLVFDMVSPMWEMAQESYIERIFKKDMDEFYVQHREAAKKGGAMDGFKDWSVINKIYKMGVSNHLLRCQGHLFATAGATPLSGDLDSKEMKAIYARFGVKPIGQKHLSHQFHSVLWKQAPKTNEWTLTTIKDRARESMLGKAINDFADDYLVGIGGWPTVETETEGQRAERMKAAREAAMAKVAAAKAAAEQVSGQQVIGA